MRRPRLACSRVSGTGTLSEAASKALLRDFGVPLADERRGRPMPTPRSRPPTQLGYPVVVKLCGAAIAHKTERGLVQAAPRRRRRGAGRGHRAARRGDARRRRRLAAGRADGRRQPGADRRRRARPAVRGQRDARRRRRARRGDRRRGVPPGADHRDRRRGDDRRVWPTQQAARRVPRRSRPSIASS